MGKNIIADHAKWPRLEDAIFKISGECKKAIAKKGKDKIINSTLGTLIDDDGNIRIYKISCNSWWKWSSKTYDLDFVRCGRLCNLSKLVLASLRHNVRRIQ